MNDMFISFYYATFPKSFLLSSLVSITTPSLVEIMILSLLIEVDSEFSCFFTSLIRSFSIRLKCFIFIEDMIYKGKFLFSKKLNSIF